MNKCRTRTRAIKRTNKPNVLNNSDSDNLLSWLKCYPMMRQPSQARLWFAGKQFSQSALAEAYEHGFEVLALELGFMRPLKAQSKPMIFTIPSAQVANVA
jgi:hypothetical protein